MMEEIHEKQEVKMSWMEPDEKSEKNEKRDVPYYVCRRKLVNE